VGLTEASKELAQSHLLYFKDRMTKPIDERVNMHVNMTVYFLSSTLNNIGPKA